MESNTQNWLLDGATKEKESITKDWQPANRRLIEGVIVKDVRPVLTGYGHLTEIFRSEWLPEQPQVDQIFASSLQPGGISAWHAHEITTDRLSVVAGQLRIVLYDAREGSPTFGLLNEIKIGAQRPMLLVIPPRVWHGVQNYCNGTAVLLNAVDYAYRYDSPDHWRVPHDSDTVPYRFPELSFG